MPIKLDKMAEVRVTEEALKSLELKTDLAFEVLKLAVETEDETQKQTLISSAERLYEYDIGTHLTKLTSPATYSFRRLNKGGKRAKKIEPFILQYILMHRKHPKKSEYKMKIAGDPNDGMGGLKAFLDAEDDRSSEVGEVFRLTQHKAAGLREAGRYDLILKAQTYVREKYFGTRESTVSFTTTQTDRKNKDL